MTREEMAELNEELMRINGRIDERLKAALDRGVFDELIDRTVAHDEAGLSTPLFGEDGRLKPRPWAAAKESK